MSYLMDKAEFTALLYERLLGQASVPGQGTDGMRLMQLLAGMLTETILLFDDPDMGLDKSICDLIALLDCEPAIGDLAVDALPPPYIIDYETEQGRALARDIFEEWLECAYQFQELIVFMIQNVIIKMEQHGQPRAETLRVFMECAARCLAYELAAQELCDVVIDRKIGVQGWSLGESVSGLSAISGRYLALSHNACSLVSVPSLPDKLDQVSYVMTQEAVRLGIPAGTDWRFGIAANDYPPNAPYDLIHSLEPQCHTFFNAINLHDFFDRAVACAKAAGRMLAVASGGKEPELEPVIGKPLAMAAMLETYKSVCQSGAIASC